MEKFFTVLGCNDEQEIACANYQLEGGAETWWRSTHPILTATHPNLPWAQFKEAFHENYFPQNFRECKEDEFMALTQGSRSVLEYQQRYEELHYFVPPHMRDNQEKARRFKRVLRSTIGAIVVPHNVQRDSEVLQMAKLVEDRQRDHYIAQPRPGMRPIPMQGTGVFE
ncbi:uncharacterized protein LOC122650736 [Telopea speciosissima]|uniref:uncharacterized protein LOC122650736 n=1 Tax=Telopea speciosissima TaxID=54955 RepID=UPI001CC371E1|nr:uncharacterized protein LOC122650736 [Telopea speciosissima]